MTTVSPDRSMPASPHRRWYNDRGIQLLLIIAAAKLLVHCLASAFTAYGYFRDELYYIACSSHPDLGYVDQPPLSIFVLSLNRVLFGDSLFALHIPPAVLGAATVFLAGLIARELGGGVRAQALAAIATLVSPIYLSMDCIYSMNAIDIACWTCTAYILIRLIKSGTPNSWIWLGVIVGLGLLNKISVLWLGTGVAAGVIFSPLRVWLKTRWPWIAAGISLLLFSPYVLWNFQHDFAHLEFIRNATNLKYGGLSPIGFLKDQLMQNHPLAAPLWFCGIVFFFIPGNRQFRPLGILYVTAFLILIVNGHSKAEYLSPVYAMLFAGGSVLLDRFRGDSVLGWLSPLYAALLVVTGAMLAPLAMPVLPVESYIRYAAVLGVKPGTSEGKELSQLPQFYADMFGWEEKAAAVSRVFNSLPPAEREKCAIFANNYGECAALDFFGKRYGLPPSIGKHNNYWLWGPREYTGELVIILGGNPEDERRQFDSVAIADTVSSAYCMPYENLLPIVVCRHLKQPLKRVWAGIKMYI